VTLDSAPSLLISSAASLSTDIDLFKPICKQHSMPI
jgi:hypothetical protein